jgi:hypothetical protein
MASAPGIGHDRPDLAPVLRVQGQGSGAVVGREDAVALGFQDLA